jgi:hypothetical protein
MTNRNNMLYPILWLITAQSGQCMSFGLAVNCACSVILKNHFHGKTGEMGISHTCSSPPLGSGLDSLARVHGTATDDPGQIGGNWLATHTRLQQWGAMVLSHTPQCDCKRLPQGPQEHQELTRCRLHPLVDTGSALHLRCKKDCWLEVASRWNSIQPTCFSVSWCIGQYFVSPNVSCAVQVDSMIHCSSWGQPTTEREHLLPS